MSKTKTTKAKGSAPASYRPNIGYCIGVKGSDKTLGFYGEHTMGDKGVLKVVSKSLTHKTTKEQAKDIIRQLTFKWPGNIYTLFKF